MFGNFIYLIIALLIYATYQPAESTNFTLFEALLLFFLLILLFGWFVRLQFKRINSRVARDSFARLDDRFTSSQTRLSVLAILLFAINIYGLNLSSFLLRMPLLSLMPTLTALIFLMLFISYLAIIWTFAYDTQNILYRSDISRRSYILSNISISVPVLLPWLLLSGISDIINILPFQIPKRILATTEGEIAYFLIFLLLVAIVGPFLIQKFWRCQPLEPGQRRKQIEAVCRKAALEYADILYWPIFSGRMITAGVMGLIKKFRYILVTGALLRSLEPNEIDAVIAHEIGHIKKKHLLFYLLFFAGYMVLSYATFDLIIYFIIYADPVYKLLNNTSFNQAAVVSTLFSLIMIVIFLIYFRYIFGFFMRNFERQADTYVFSIFDSAVPLISTLYKIALTSGQPPDRPNWHHFSIQQRVDYLSRCEADRSWIDRQDRKVLRSIALFLSAIFLIGVIGYNLNFGETGKKINAHFFEKALLREIDQTPDNTNLHALLGDLYYSKNKYAPAVTAYERSLTLDAVNPRALNNLAWLLATCEDENFKDPQRALALASKAASLQTVPHILDTLAESYYVNERYEEAVAAGIRALELDPKKRTYYEGQLKKYRQAAKSGGLGG